MNRRAVAFIALVILAALLVLDRASMIDLGHLFWLVCAFLIVASATIITTPSEKDVGNG